MSEIAFQTPAERLTSICRKAYGLLLNLRPWRFGKGVGPMSAQDGFDAELAAQFVGFMLILAGGQMDKVVMSKFLYMGDREGVLRKGTPLFNDRHFALPEGPICLYAVDGLNGKKNKKVFDRYVKRDGDTLTLAPGLDGRHFGRMSEGIFTIAKNLWDEFGGLTREELVEHTHGPDFPEWRKAKAEYDRVGGSRAEIVDAEFAAALGVDPEAYSERAEYVRQLQVASRRSGS